MNGGRVLIAVVAIVAGMLLSQSVTRRAAAPTGEVARSYVTVRRLRPYHGMAVQISSSHDAVQRYGKLIREVADLGADTLLLSVDVYQEHAASPVVKPDAERLPSRKDLLAILKVAEEVDLRVILMPKVLLSDPRGNEWRGVIQPNNWDEWFASYGEFVASIADVAREGRVEVLMVGSELVSTEKYTERWQTVIANVRKRFGGLLGYSANWDHYKNIEFWKDLDVVALTTYYKLADDVCPPLEELLEAWKPIKQGILAWQATVGKPLFFTEVGWCSQEGAAEFPWNYYHKQEATAAGHEEQRRLYVAFMKTWQDVPQTGGIIWWEWTESEGGKEDFDYTPRSKPAEKELRRWFTDVRLRRADAAAGAVRPASEQNGGQDGVPEE